MSQDSIFICYRRTDAGWAGRLEDELKGRFPEQSVFRDRGIPAGVPWRQHIDGVLQRCDVMLVLIGPSWAAAGTAGVARLWEDHDVVRLEIEGAMRRPDVQVIPLLFDGATMPTTAQLPPGIQALTEHNAHEVSDTRWRYDMQVLGDRIAAFVPERTPQLSRPPAPTPSPPSADRRAPALAMTAVAGVAGLVAWPVAGSNVWPGPARADAFTPDWIAITAQRLVAIGAHRAILWGFIFALALAAAYLAMRSARTGAPAGLMIGLSSGALAGALGAGVYIAVKEAVRAGELTVSEPVLNGVGVAVTGALIAGRFAALRGPDDMLPFRAVGIAGGLLAGLLGGIVSDASSQSVGWMVQSIVLIGALAAVFAGPATTQHSPALRTART